VKTKHQRISGKVRVAIRQGEQIVKEFVSQDNLILDQGLDMAASTVWNQVFVACAAGSGTTPTSEDLGASATVIGTALQTNIPVLSNALLDADVVFPGGDRFKIQSVTDASNAILFQSGEISVSTPFHIEFTNQSGLTTELKRTSNYLTSPGACGTTVTPGIITLQRTFLFPAETVDTTYAELGFSPNNVAAPNLFSRILLSSPITVLGPAAEVPGGQQLQVTYQLLIEFDYGRGSGNYFLGRTASEIPVSGLPIIYSIFAYANSATHPGNLAVSVAGVMPALVGGIVTLASSSVGGYNGNWNVIDSSQFTDGIHGISTLLTLQVPWSTGGTGGTLNTDLSGQFFRACQGIFYVGSQGQSAAPIPTDDIFQGFGEPSIGSNGWASTVPGSALGDNLEPVPIDPNNFFSVPTVLLTYNPGNFYQDQQAAVIIGDTDDNSAISSFGFGIPDRTNQIETWVWNQPQELAGGSTLSLTFRTSWGRE
jgi:hypothetical protein